MNVQERRTVLGAKALRLQAILKPHTPKKKRRKIFVKTRFKEIRQRIIAQRRQIELLCREAYEKRLSKRLGIKNSIVQQAINVVHFQQLCKRHLASRGWGSSCP